MRARGALHSALIMMLCLGVVACGEDDPPVPAPPTARAAVAVSGYTPGAGAGFGQERMPEVVLGLPQGKGNLAGGLDVLSLGVGGEVVLEFPTHIIDGPGADLLVFENPFWPGGDATKVFAELAEVAVSADGETWLTFPCAPEAPESPGRWPGCAGWTPTRAFTQAQLDAGEVPLTHEALGGDAFDLADLGVERVRFVRVRDRSTEGVAPSAGFDLDAVVALHTER